MASSKGTESATDAWEWFDQSRLSFWLRHDYWRPELAISLLSNIDPANSVESRLTAEDVLDLPLDEKVPDFLPPHFDRIALLSENPVFSLEPHFSPESEDVSRAEAHIREELSRQEKDSDSVSLEFIDLVGRMHERALAERKRSDIWTLFKSNISNSRYSYQTPSDWVKWAIDKDLRIDWLDWAISRGFLKEPSPRRRGELDVRERTTLLNIIGALLELLTGETRGKPNSLFRNQEAIIAELQERHRDKAGLAPRTLQEKFASANRSIKTTD